VELDIVMPSTTPLWKAHDIAQILQDKIEVLPGVDRAFVHVDHETTHAPVCIVLTELRFLTNVRFPLQEHRKHV
jgi:divalent metal cation (Fe/Co/Zn/Cd) transporter